MKKTGATLIYMLLLVVMGSAQTSTMAIDSEELQSFRSSSLQLSHAAGIYDESFSLVIQGQNDTEMIYFTTDGSAPSTSDILYEGPLEVGEGLYSQAEIYQVQISPPGYFYPENYDVVPRAIVVRAAAFDQSNQQVSEIVTQTYFIREDEHVPDLPIISICGEYEDFFDEDEGILVPGIFLDENDPQWTGNYYQRGRAWEREVNIEYIEGGIPKINQSCGIRTHGGNGRRFTQKSLRVYARNDYEAPYFSYPFFESTEQEQFKRLVLRPFASSWSGAGIEDKLANDIAKSLIIDSPHSTPVVLYLNGEYWGVYYLQERINKHYFELRYEVDEDCIDLIDSWGGNAALGSNEEFMELYEFIENHDLSIPSNFVEVEEKIDIDDFIDYHLLEIFIANYDWPTNNMKCWKNTCGDNKWRWIFYDGDAAFQDYSFDAFSHATNTSDAFWPTNGKSTLFLRKLMENESFIALFFNRLEELLNGSFSQQVATSFYKDNFKTVEEEVVYQIQRFEVPENLDEWHEAQWLVQDYASFRTCEMVNQLKDIYSWSVKVASCESFCNELDKLSISPNPAKQNPLLTFVASRTGLGIISISGLNGRTVASREVAISAGTNSIPLRTDWTLSSGVYIVSLRTAECSTQVKFIVL